MHTRRVGSTDYDDLRPDRVREVLAQPDTDGGWIAGDLEAVEKRHGMWRGYVRYSLGAGEGNYLGWFSEDRIRGDAEKTGQ